MPAFPLPLPTPTALSCRSIAGAASALRRLRLIWISHAHADHHLGLCTLLVAVAAHGAGDGVAQPTLVVGPLAIGRWLEAYASLLPLATRPRFRFVSCAAFNAPRCAERQWLLRQSGLGLCGLQSVRVVHCPDAWGVVLDHSAGWRLVYSGDTRPSEALVAAGRGATLLIHEATFSDDQAAMAAAKRHCCRSEALRVAAQMGAYRTVLTHLSQRYECEAERNGGGGAAWADARSFVAYDLLTVNLADLPVLPDQAPLLAAYFRRFARREEQRAEAERRTAAARTEEIERGLETAAWLAKLLEQIGTGGGEG